MKKLLFFTIMTVYSNFCLAWNPPDGSMTFTSDSRAVTISTIPASPTQIFTRDSFIQRGWIINPSSFTVHLATSSVGFSTNTTPGIPGVTAGNQPIVFTLDGVNSPYWGAIWAVNEGATPATIYIFRTK